MEKTNDPLIGKIMLNSKGTIIGKIHESIKDGDSGKIVSVLIVPSKELHLKKYSLTKNGEIVVSFSLLSTVKDAFIIEELAQ